MERALHERIGGFLLAHQARDVDPGRKPGLSVTISREAGAGGSSVAEQLAHYLNEHQPHGGGEWMVVSQNVVEMALEQHRLPRHLEQYMAEDRRHLVSDTVEDLLGLHPASSELVRQVSETMLNLARRGNVILVGRGGNVLTSRLRNVLHVRLIAPMVQRLKNVQRHYNFSAEDALDFLAKMDRARARYLRQNFGARVEDPLGYDLVINTGRIGFLEAARLIGEVVLDRSRRARADFPLEEVEAWSRLHLLGT